MSPALTRSEFRTLANNGLWKQNASLVQILGLCPLLAVTTNAVNGVMLATATVLVMLIANVAVSALRHWVPHEIRIPVFVLIIAALVTIVDLLFNAFLHPLYLILGIFIPLIVTNCIVLARVEAFAAKNAPVQSAVDGVFMGFGLIWTLALLGGIRELIAGGTLLSGIELVFDGVHALQVLPAGYEGPLLALLPPGGFIVLGCLIAWKNWSESLAARRRGARPPEPVAAGGCH